MRNSSLLCIRVVPCQRAGVQQRTPERAADERQVLLQRLVRQPHSGEVGVVSSDWRQSVTGGVYSGACPPGLAPVGDKCPGAFCPSNGQKPAPSVLGCTKCPVYGQQDVGQI